MMRALLFPGQGSQKKGMGAALFEQYSAFVHIADHVLGYSIKELCLRDPRNELNKTIFTQPAIYVTSCIAYEAQRGNMPEPSFLAGHSVGEYAALYAAGTFDFETGLRIVKRRAEEMSAVAGGLVAVVGQSREAVLSLLGSFAITDLEIANLNSPTQTVIGGPVRSLKKFVALCSEFKVRAVMLPVSGPFHTSHMRKASAAFATYLKTIDFSAPRIPVYSNTTTKPHELGSIKAILADHIAQPVKWIGCIEAMADDGAEIFVEVAERQILTPLVSEIVQRRKSRPKVEAAPEQKPHRSARMHLSRAREFCQIVGCRKPVIATSLGNGASNAAIVKALAEAGTLAFLDVNGTELSHAEHELAKLSGVNGPYGIAISAESYAYCRADQLLRLIDDFAIRFLELRGFARVPERLQTFLADRQDVFLISRAGTAPAIDSHFNYAASRPSGTSAICVDVLDSDDQPNTSWSATIHALAVRETHAKANPDAQVFLGVCGISGNPWSIKSLLSMGLDFASAGSVLLATQEANVDPNLKAGLSRATFAHFQKVPNWHYPEFGKSVWAYLPDARTGDVLKKLHRIYMEESDARQFQQALSAIRTTGEGASELRHLSTEAQRQSAALIDMRRRLRIAVRDWLKPLAVTSDTSIAQWNAWKSNAGLSLPEFPSAPHAMELLFPDDHTGAQQNVDTLGRSS